MNAYRPLKSTLAVACLLGLTALAQAQGLSRDAVRFELSQSLRGNDVVVGGEAGLTERQLRAQRGQAPAMTAGKTRDQVKNEFQQATASGSILSHGVLMLPVADLAPHRYPARPALAMKSRAQVKQELELAKRLGDAPVGSEDGLTPAQRMPAHFMAARNAQSPASKAAAHTPGLQQAGVTVLR